MLNKIVEGILGIAAAIAIMLAVVGVVCKITGCDKPAEVKEVCTVRFGNYVRAVDGLYAGFEGWIVSKDGITVTVNLNDDSVPAEYIRRAVPEYRLATREANSTEMVFLARELKNCPRPLWVAGRPCKNWRIHGSSVLSCGCKFDSPEEVQYKAMPSRMLNKCEKCGMYGLSDLACGRCSVLKNYPKCKDWSNHGNWKSPCGCEFNVPVKLFNAE